ncbi:MAG: phosphopantothenoylcysteine decarboxylase [Planctomycetes bacterium]|nr:phosphopantothenoylcysteine decarboxylase [Planctomycetota bacterium]
MANILLGVTGSAACFKAAACASQLTQLGHRVQVVLTPAACEFVTELQFSCLTSVTAISRDDSQLDPAGMEHISLARQANMMLIMPATANTVGQIANGLASNLLCTLALAMRQDIPRLIVPAMNPEMYLHPAVQRNLQQLKDDGWQQLGPVKGNTACQEQGDGRMLEVEDVLSKVVDVLA